MQKHRFLFLLLSLGFPIGFAQEDVGAPRLLSTGEPIDERFEDAVRKRYRGDVRGAIALYDTFLAENPRDVAVLVSLGAAYWELGELKTAEEWFKKAQVVVPRHIKASQFLGKLYYDTGRFREAKAEFERLLTFEKIVPDVKGSAHVNLGKIALVEGRYRDADEQFRAVADSDDNGDRATAEKGRMMGVRLRRTLLWERISTPHLNLVFSPDVSKAHNQAAREQWAKEREAAYVAMSKKLGVDMPGPVPMYVFADNVDAYSISNQEDVHSFRYSWWFVWTEWGRDAGHDLAHQLASRCPGSRPASQMLVEGLCCWLDTDSSDPHAVARGLVRAGKMRSLVDWHADQSYSLDEARTGAESLVAFLIERHGLESFLKSYVAYNLVRLNPEWRVQATGQYRWAEALTEIFRAGIGQSLAEVEAEWLAFLRG